MGRAPLLAVKAGIWNGFFRKVPRPLAEGFALNLRQAGIDEKWEAYSSKALRNSLLSGLATLALGAAFFPATAMPIALLAAVITSFTYALFPLWQKERRAGEVECELGITLESVSLLLEFGLGFEEALLSAPKGKAVQELFEQYRNRVRAGESPAAAMQAISPEVSSKSWKRACAQLAFAYHQGGEASHLKGSADELFDLQNRHFKKYAKRLEMLGLLFVASGCLIPALFGAYAIISPLIGQPMLEVDVYIAYLVAFPAISAAIVVVATAAKPPIAEFYTGGQTVQSA